VGLFKTLKHFWYPETTIDSNKIQTYSHDFVLETMAHPHPGPKCDQFDLVRGKRSLCSDGNVGVGHARIWRKFQKHLLKDLSRRLARPERSGQNWENWDIIVGVQWVIHFYMYIYNIIIIIRIYVYIYIWMIYACVQSCIIRTFILIFCTGALLYDVSHV